MSRPHTHHSSVRLRARAVPARRSAGPWLVGLAAGVLACTGAFLVPTGPAPAAPVPLAAHAAAPAPVDDRLPDCAAVVAAMSPRALLAQRLMVGVDAADPAAAAETVRTSQVGGVFLPGNATALLRDQALRALQAGARLPVTVAVDDEGGRVQRIDELDGDLPSARAMSGMTTDEVRALAVARGRALAARGVTQDIAPVVDLGGQSAREVIGDRSFGTDPNDVTRYALAFAEGLREAGIEPVVKHFPGHGRADGDSHAGRVTTPPLDELRSADLRPYADLVGPGAPLATGPLPAAVMVGHLDVPGLTDGLPSSLTPAVYALLRDEYGFAGVVYTDDLGAMKAVTGQYELPEAVLAALDAGADVALWSAGGDPDPILDALEPALAAGTLDAGENTAAVTRVLRSKSVCG
ncbi:glycoside hydrolase family 3 protein [Pseudonocardia sp. KRD-184]|uniref:Glycoside hydrolase family 3 protein n=1 Tax=Pseudonocardia oceani TaxID=2792013 RepID=A0ABS6UCZ0_9PSEU|nr:glycoside hydrolase family 3 N-terminal domain-containing protein [Pseudonocardia oceani]MBW0088579.1 glycoside hydrolase family 3 protein [Pseudonocardia oceani]MBW0094434.1 glycoside hydrolase family 3 protein [Pseudonocardia oceani]MBW0108161.1 glycoside hydrolase family 3 protein [Pseudonocardia oceani]MBW0119959.1 glycoside hydrolase family 3 protein [Pseudonocardia oceani]MBW0130039.1 glycoside hydrolase family 3 protein [Pseudonocardia oceani]